MHGGAFEQLYREHAPEVQRFVQWLTGSAAEAEEVTAETFVRALTARAPVRAATVRSYLLSIARNLVADERRRRKRHTELTEAVPAVGWHGEAAVAVYQVKQALGEIGHHYSVPLLMRAEGGLTYEEIAQVLNLPLATVKVRIHRARLKLAQKVKLGQETPK